MLQKDKFNFYYLDYKTYFIDVYCVYEDIDLLIKKETKALFSMLILALKLNIRLHLKNLNYIDLEYINIILDFARDLREHDRTLIVSGAPLPLIRFLEKFHFDTILLIQE